jgi:hypothetical protein
MKEKESVRNAILLAGLGRRRWVMGGEKMKEREF